MVNVSWLRNHFRALLLRLLPLLLLATPTSNTSTNHIARRHAHSRSAANHNPSIGGGGGGLPSEGVIHLRFRHRRSSFWANKNETTPPLALGLEGAPPSGSGLTWPVKRVAEIPGDIVIGGLHMVHERESKSICGPVMPQGGLQAAEVMLYTVDRVNALGILPGNLTLGAYVLDDCDKDTYGLQQAVDFIKGSITNIDDDAEYKCKDGSSPEIRNKVISGVVGAASSVTSIQVANLLRLFKIPQISFFSTSPELSNKQRFEYFSRTIPSDHYQTMAMAKIVEQLEWKYMSIIYEESNYGIKAFEELERLLTKRGICVAVKEKLTKDSGVAGVHDYDHIVEKLLAKPKAKGVIIFGSDQEVAELMKAVKRMNATGKFNWIGSDGWSARALVSDGNEAEVEGTLSVQPQANPVKGFKEYFLNLTVQTNQRNPWFVEFWEDHFKCRYPGGLPTPYNQNYTKTCSGEERLTAENTQFEAQLQFVSDAVMAFAHAFRDMHKAECGDNHVGLCAKMIPVNGETLLKFLREVNFTGLTGDKFKFNSKGDGPARYNIIHYKQVEKGVYKWVNVGFFHDEAIELNMTEVQFQLGNPKPPDSLCSLPCAKGQMKKYVEGESCCWTCHECGQYQKLDPDDETRCLVCPNGTLPDSLHLNCTPLPEDYLRPDSSWAIGAMTFAMIGIVLASGVLIVFIKNNDTPVVRASGRELSYVLLIGLLLCYGLTFILMVKPTTFICGVQEFMIGLCFSIVYGALLTKTNRISRIFNAGKRTAKRPNFISPKSQLLICSGMVFVQILINVIWLLVSPPEAIHHHPTREDNLLVCKASINASYMIAFSYPILLVVICTVYAVLTRKIPEAFNESKFIGFSMYTTCIIWLAFIPIYFTTAQHVALRITSMSVTISLSATVTIVCLFTPKLYIILLHPEKNIRQSMMNQSKYQSVKTSQNGPTPGTAIAAGIPANNGPVTTAQLPSAQSANKNNGMGNGSIEVKERMPLMQNNQLQQTSQPQSAASNSCATCSSCGAGASNLNGGGDQQIKIKPSLEVVRQEQFTQTASESKIEVAVQTEFLEVVEAAGVDAEVDHDEVREEEEEDSQDQISYCHDPNCISYRRSLASLGSDEMSMAGSNSGSGGASDPEPSGVREVLLFSDAATQTSNRWLTISLGSPPLSLTQEVPDVVL